MNHFKNQEKLRGKKWWRRTMIVFCLIVIAGATTGASYAIADDLKLDLAREDVGAESTSEDNETSETENSDGDLAVGDSFEGGVWTYTVYGIREADRIDELDNEFLVAEAGPNEKFVIVDFGIKNKTDESQEFFGMLIDYKIRADSGLTFTPDFDAEVALKQPIAEGMIGPGLENRGEVAFKVPRDATGLKFDVSEEPGAIWRLLKKG